MIVRGVHGEDVGEDQGDAEGVLVGHRQVRDGTAVAKARLATTLVAIARRHGKACKCARFLSATSIGIENSLVIRLGEGLPPKTLLTLDMVARRADRIRTDEFDEVRRRLAAVRSLPCVSLKDEGFEPVDTPWRDRRRLGVHAVDDRWPDEWDSVEWAEYASPREPQDKGPRALSDAAHGQAAARLVGQFWAWNSVPPTEDPLDLSRWGQDDLVRAVWILRSTDGYPWEARIAQIGSLAMAARQPFDEARRFIRYVDECAHRLCVVDPKFEVMLKSLHHKSLASLGERFRMINEFGEEVETEVFQDPDAVDGLSSIADEEHRSPVGRDGQPDPLALIQKLLPGGEWVLGRADIVHCPTELETELLPAIENDPPTLVILSGNAGDGKTAFIEDVLRRAGLDLRSSGSEIANETRVVIGGKPYLVVLDGSEDTVDRTNSQLLEDAFGSFKGSEVVEPEQGTLIAVNKGRLLSFLEGRGDEYPLLWNLVQRRFIDGSEVEDQSYKLIDLNDRTVVGPSLEDSLFGGVLGKLVNLPDWDECEKCDAYLTCPVMFNLAALRIAQVRRQLWELFALIDLDDRLHVTARHVVTRLASVISGGLRCPDIRASIAGGEPLPQRAYFYGAAFLGRSDESSVEEAILNGIASAYDPAETADPQRDREIGTAIAAGSITEILRVVEGEPTTDHGALDDAAAALALRSVDSPASSSDVEYRRAHLLLMSRLLRRRYFLGDHSDVVPVNAFSGFMHTVESGEGDALARRLIRSLNGTLGISRSEASLVVPRDYAHGLAGSGFALQVPLETFLVLPGTGLGTQYRTRKYVRSWPRSIRVEARDGDVLVASLSIPLLMLEILDRADRGFRPTSRTERNYMIRVGTFYRLLAEHQWRQPLDYVLFEHGRIRAAVNLVGGNLDFWGR